MHANQAHILAALADNPGPLVEWAAERLVALGSKSEWDLDDNFGTTESLAYLAEGYGLPGVGDQSDTDLRFYGEAAQSLGYPCDLDNF